MSIKVLTFHTSNNLLQTSYLIKVQKKPVNSNLISLPNTAKYSPQGGSLQSKQFNTSSDKMYIFMLQAGRMYLECHIDLHNKLCPVVDSM